MSAAPAGSAAPEVVLEAPLVLYDGVCGFCNRSIQWLVARDPEARLRFAPLQGTTAATLRQRHPEIPEALETLVLVEPQAGGERVWLRSDAALRVLGWLPAPWRFGSWLRWIPRALRDVAYDAFARRRYAWFGELDACPVPPAKLRARFLD